MDSLHLAIGWWLVKSPPMFCYIILAEQGRQSYRLCCVFASKSYMVSVVNRFDLEGYKTL